MKNQKFRAMLLIILLVGLTSLACSSLQSTRSAPAANADPATESQATLAGDIPVYPGAGEYETGNNMIMDAMLTPMLEQFESQYGGQAQVKFHSVPQGTTGTDISTFYNEKLTALGWQAEEVPQNDPSAVSMVWTKGNQDLFVVTFMEIPQMESMLITIVAQQG